MTDIKISPTAQLIALAGLGGAIVAGVVVQLPELKRYMKIRSMD